MKNAFVRMLWLFFISLQPWPTPAEAQTWEWARRFGLEENESCREIIVRPDGDCYWAGTFEGATQVGSDLLSSQGENDLLIVRSTPAGDPQWVRQVGSSFDDEIGGLGVDAAGRLYVGGTYWLEAGFGPFTLTTTRNPKGIFVAKYDEDGTVLWARGIDGTGSKDLGGIAVTETGGLFLTGYFSDSLFLADTVLAASGATDLFAARLDAEGELLWAGNWGYSGDARATCLTPDGEDGVVLGGFYNDTLIVAGELIRSISLDLDVFLLRLDGQGQPLWLRKAGGVQDQEITGLARGPEGGIYGAGFLVGVMSLGNGVSIESQTGNPDAYLFHYNLSGEPVGARTFGNELTQQPLQLTTNGSNLLVAGLYQGELSIDGQTAPAGTVFAGFTAGFAADLSLRWLRTVTADAPVVSYAVAAGPAGVVYTGGAFGGTASFGGQTLQSVGENDAFLGRLPSSLTPIWEQAEGGAGIRVFPNPASDCLVIESEGAPPRAQLIDAGGRVVRRIRNARRFDLSGLPPGWYGLQVWNLEGRLYREKILIIRP